MSGQIRLRLRRLPANTGHKWPRCGFRTAYNGCMWKAVSVCGIPLPCYGRCRTARSCVVVRGYVSSIQTLNSNCDRRLVIPVALPDVTPNPLSFMWIMFVHLNQPSLLFPKPKPLKTHQWSKLLLINTRQELRGGCTDLLVQIRNVTFTLETVIQHDHDWNVARFYFIFAFCFCLTACHWQLCLKVQCIVGKLIESPLVI